MFTEDMEWRNMVGGLSRNRCPRLCNIEPPGGFDNKESACNAGDPSSIPGLERFPGGGNGNPLQYSCLKNPMDRGAWQATIYGVEKSQTQLSNIQTLLCNIEHGRT